MQKHAERIQEWKTVSPRDTMQAMRRKAADAARKGTAVGGLRDAYVVYGNTERLCGTLCGQAEYAISAAERKAGEVRLTEEGEEVGTGHSVWHTGSFSVTSPI